MIARTQESLGMDNTNVFDNESIWIFQQMYETLYTVSPADGIRARVGPGVAVSLSDGADTAAAAVLAGSSDVAVVVVGDLEREGVDRPNLSLTGNQDELVRSVVAANPRTVVVLNSGAPVLVPWVAEVPAKVARTDRRVEAAATVAATAPLAAAPQGAAARRVRETRGR